MGGTSTKRVYVVGTADTKGEELGYLSDRIAEAGPPVVRADVGTRAPAVEVDIPASEIAAHHPEGADAVLGGADRGAAVAAMGLAFERFIVAREDVAGIGGVAGPRSSRRACGHCRSACRR